MSTLIERVARRLVELEEDDPDGPTIIPDRPARWMLMIEDAQSIIALMGEPIPEAMLKAGRECQPFMADWTPGQIVAASVWRDMLAAALADKPRHQAAAWPSPSP